MSKKIFVSKASYFLVLVLALTLIVGCGLICDNSCDINTAYATSILNYDDSLGIFQDLTKAEVKEYYLGLEKGLKGNELLKNLQPILKDGQIKVKYNSGNTSSTAWDGYYLLERDWTMSPLTEEEKNGQYYNRTNIYIDPLYCTDPLFIVTGINKEDMQYFNGTSTVDALSGAQLDREHVLPKSFGFNADGDGYQKLTAGCDMQNLHAGEHNGNSAGHNNLPFGNVVSNKEDILSSINGEIVGYKGLNANGIDVFEPIDEDKGDIARSVFYMCARYNYYEDLGDGDETPAITLSNNAEKGTTVAPLQTKNAPAEYGMLDDLLAWHDEDPVSEFEIHRNNLCYNAIQFNRNPFIDYPDWVDVAFDATNTKGIDLEQENGVEVDAFLKATFKNSIMYKGDKVLESDLTFKFTNELKVESTLNLSDLTYKIYFNNKGIESDLLTYQFNEVGKYEIEFSYVYNSKIYNSKVSIDIKNPYEIKIENNIDDLYQKKKSLDLSNLEIYFYNRGVKTALADYEVKVLDKDGNVVSESETYAFDKIGKYTISIYKIVDGEEISTSFNIVVLPETWVLIVAGVAVAIVIIVIIVIIVLNRKKVKKIVKKAAKKRKSE